MMSELTNGNDIHTKYALHAQKTEFQLKELNSKLTEQVQIFKEHVQEDKQESQKHLDILDKISMQVDKLNTKIDLSTQKLQSEIEKINQLDEIQNEQLRIHIEGVRTNKAALELYKEEHAARLLELEKPREWFKTTKKGAIWISAVGGAIVLILKAFGVY